MGTSTFEILIVPVFWATLGSCVAGAAILALLNAVEALAGRMSRMARSPKVASQGACDPRCRVHRTIARGVGTFL
jgi:hypothetical protein